MQRPAVGPEASRTGFRCGRSVPNTSLTTESQIGYSRGLLRATSFVAFILADTRQRPQGPFQVPGGPPQGERVRFVDQVPIRPYIAVRRAFSASASVCRIARADVGIFARVRAVVVPVQRLRRLCSSSSSSSDIGTLRPSNLAITGSGASPVMFAHSAMGAI